jgi:hypothetical protein
MNRVQTLRRHLRKVLLVRKEPRKCQLGFLINNVEDALWLEVYGGSMRQTFLQKGVKIVILICYIVYASIISAKLLSERFRGS